MAVPIVFWVEDNLNDVALVRQAFEETGLAAKFVVPDNAVLAFKYIAGREPYSSSPRPPDLILVDLNLPIIRGAIRSWMSWPSTSRGETSRVVIMASSNSPQKLRA